MLLYLAEKLNGGSWYLESISKWYKINFKCEKNDKYRIP
jgi:hypothetical protein